MGKIVGIDLGTTNSAVAYVNRIGDRINIMPILNSDGQYTTPSVVSWEENGNICVGELAKNQAVLYPNTTVRSIKRCMGIKDRKKCEYLPEKIEYTPEEISAIILTKLIRDAQLQIGEKITRVVVSVPAYFRDGERQATKAATLIAGFKEDEIKIVEEPNAAAMSYLLDHPEINNAKILIFDFGGGTFDVSIVDVSNRKCNVKDNGGERRLGGDDFDQRIIDYLVNEFKKEHRIDLKSNSYAMQLLKTEAEKAKIRLSNNTITKIVIANIDSNMKIDKELTRDKFNELTKDLVEKTKKITKQTLDHARIRDSQIYKVIMVGGSSKIPAVQNAVKEIFPGKRMAEDIILYEPDLAIAKGAAIYAAIFFDPKTEEENKIKKELMGGTGGIGSGETVTTHDLGISAIIDGIEGRFSRIIEKGTPRPTSNTETYYTSIDNQTSVNIEIYEGEKDVAEENELWSKFTITDIPASPKGVEKIDVTFEYAIDQTLRVSVKVLSTGKITEKFVDHKISDNELATGRDKVNTQIKCLR